MENKQFNNSPHPVPSQATGSMDNSQRTLKVSDLSASGSVSRNERSLLGADFKPSAFSVICGRGKDSYDHVGNHHFRELASMFVARYGRAGSKADKTDIVSEMVGMIHQAEGTFCKFEKGAWYKVDDCYAREKAGALLRDMVHTQRALPVKAKKAKKTKAKPARSKIPKQIKTGTQSQQNDQKLVTLTAAGYSSKHQLVHGSTASAGRNSDFSIPTHEMSSAKQQLVEDGTTAGCGGHSDDSTMSTWSQCGEDSGLGFEENSLADDEDYFDMLVFEWDDSLEEEDDYFDIFRMDATILTPPPVIGGPYAAVEAACYIVGIPPFSLFGNAASPVLAAPHNIGGSVLPSSLFSNAAV
jgi:hypothetical protein